MINEINMKRPYILETDESPVSKKFRSSEIQDGEVTINPALFPLDVKGKIRLPLLEGSTSLLNSINLINDLSSPTSICSANQVQEVISNSSILITEDPQKNKIRELLKHSQDVMQSFPCTSFPMKVPELEEKLNSVGKNLEEQQILDLKVLETFQQMEGILKGFRQSFLSYNRAQIGKKLTHMPDNETIEKSKKNLLVLTKYAYPALGIFYAYDEIFYNITFKSNQKPRTSCYSGIQAIKFLLPVSIIKEVFIPSIPTEKKLNTRNFHLLNAIIKHPKGPDLVEFLKMKFPNVSLEPFQGSPIDSIEATVKYCSLQNMEFFLRYIICEKGVCLQGCEDGKGNRVTSTAEKLRTLIEKELTSYSRITKNTERPRSWTSPIKEKVMEVMKKCLTGTQFKEFEDDYYIRG